jgi:hypothetical protein
MNEMDIPDPTSIENSFPKLNLKDIQAGNLWCLIDDRQFGGSKVAQLARIDTLKEGFRQEDLQYPPAKNKKTGQLNRKASDFQIAVAHLEEGDLLLAVGTGDGEYEALMQVEEKDTVGDFEASVKKDGDGHSRLMDRDSNEIKKMVEAGARDDQIYLAYKEAGYVTVPVKEKNEISLKWEETGTFTQEWHYVNGGVLQSLQRDWGVRLYKLTDELAFARFIGSHARRVDHTPSKKSGKVGKKKGLSLEARQRILLSTLFDETKAEALLSLYQTPAEIFHILQNCPFTAKGNPAPKYIQGWFKPAGVGKDTVRQAIQVMGMATFDFLAEKAEEPEETQIEKCEAMGVPPEDIAEAFPEVQFEYYETLPMEKKEEEIPETVLSLPVVLEAVLMLDVGPNDLAEGVRLEAVAMYLNVPLPSPELFAALASLVLEKSLVQNADQSYSPG